MVIPAPHNARMISGSIRRAAARLTTRRGLALAGAGVLALTVATPGTASARTAPLAARTAPPAAGTAPPAAGTAPPAAHPAELAARADAYRLCGATSVDGHRGVLRNDAGRPLTVVRHTDPAHGTLTL